MIDDAAERCIFIVPRDGAYKVEERVLRDGSPCRVQMTPISDMEDVHEGWNVAAKALEGGRYVLLDFRKKDARAEECYPTAVCQPKLVVKRKASGLGVLKLEFGIDDWQNIALGPYYLHPADYVRDTQAREEGESAESACWPSQSVLREILVQRLCAQLNTQPYGPQIQKVVDELLNTHRNFVMHGSFGAT